MLYVAPLGQRLLRHDPRRPRVLPLRARSLRPRRQHRGSWRGRSPGDRRREASLGAANRRFYSVVPVLSRRFTHVWSGAIDNIIAICSDGIRRGCGFIYWSRRHNRIAHAGSAQSWRRRGGYGSSRAVGRCRRVLIGRNTQHRARRQHGIAIRRCRRRNDAAAHWDVGLVCVVGCGAARFALMARGDMEQWQGGPPLGDAALVFANVARGLPEALDASAGTLLCLLAVSRGCRRRIPRRGCCCR